MVDVLYLGPADLVGHVVSQLPPTVRVHHAPDEATVDALLPECAFVLDASMRIRFDAARLSRAGRLRAYVTATTGADHVDEQTLAARAIPLLTLRGQTEALRNVTATAEHSWLLLMACARRLRAAVDHVLAGGWDRTQFPGLMLRGRMLGIVGCGRIGSWMGTYGRAFGMHVIGFDPHVESWPEHIVRRSLESLLAEADFMSLHVPLTEETRGLLDRGRIGAMKPGAVLINTSRGEVVDEAALLGALASGRLAAAALDVIGGEPDTAAHPLVEYARRHDNLVVTPHIGGFSPDAVRHVLAFSCSRIATLMAGTDV